MSVHCCDPLSSTPDPFCFLFLFSPPRVLGYIQMWCLHILPITSPLLSPPLAHLPPLTNPLRPNAYHRRDPLLFLSYFIFPLLLYGPVCVRVCACVYAGIRVRLGSRWVSNRLCPFGYFFPFCLIVSCGGECWYRPSLTFTYLRYHLRPVDSLGLNFFK